MNPIHIHCSTKYIYFISQQTFVNHAYYRKELTADRVAYLSGKHQIHSRVYLLISEGVAPNGLARNHMLVLTCMSSNPSVNSLFYLETKSRDRWIGR